MNDRSPVSRRVRRETRAKHRARAHQCTCSSSRESQLELVHLKKTRILHRVRPFVRIENVQQEVRVNVPCPVAPQVGVNIPPAPADPVATQLFDPATSRALD